MVPVKPYYLKCCTPPYGGEQGRKGNRLPCPSKGIEYRSQRTYGGAAVSIRGAETVTVQRLSVQGCDASVPRSEWLGVGTELPS